uniref:Uncharacterized protein n=2 Tax=Oryza sativa subsp. japonica TaxID=39947 RepID=Q53N30_ORYSJ|nr:hypothetical protein LOC_Os11g16660 [Oryza sativa Japonica Group]ABA92598.1 hypothetical protein LOC_Os11g16660 [Oryza sativa Japonica Group]
MGPLGGDDLGRQTSGGRSMAWCSRRAVAGGVRRAGSGKETAVSGGALLQVELRGRNCKDSGSLLFTPNISLSNPSERMNVEQGRGRQCARLRLAGAERSADRRGGTLNSLTCARLLSAVRRSWVLVGSKIRIDAKEQSRSGLPFPIISGQ